MNRFPFPRAALLVAASTALVDVLTKIWAFGVIPEGEIRRVAGDWFLLTARFNRGLPWSFLEGTVSPEIFRWVLPVLSIAAVVVLWRILRGTEPSERLKILGFALILGGAAGNLWDRAWTAVDPAHGGVRDFLLFPRIVFGRAFPAFNLADTWITIGVVLVGWRLLFEKEPVAAAPEGSAA